jgi:Phage integrase family
VTPGVTSRSRVHGRVTVRDICHGVSRLSRRLRFHKPHELHAVDFADGDEACLLGGFDGAVKSLPASLVRGFLRVMENLEQTKIGIRLKAPKTDRARSVTLPVFAIAELRRLKIQQAQELLKLGIRQIGDTLVCARVDGGPLQPQNLTHQFARLIGRIEDFPHIGFHDLRHSHATQLLSAGVHPKIAQERLGHA